MRKNKLTWMALLALLGFLGIFTENRGFLGFFGFLAYLRYLRVVQDELFVEYVRRSASLAFFGGIGVFGAATLLRELFWGDPGLAVGLTVGFVSSIFFFSGAMLSLEFQEQKGMRE